MDENYSQNSAPWCQRYAAVRTTRIAAGYVIPTLLLSVTQAGCTAPQQARPTIDVVGQTQQAEAALVIEIREFVDYFEATIEHATVAIDRRSPHREHRRAAALWRTRLVDECRSLANQTPSQEAMVDLWTLCQRQLDYFSKGDGKSLFGEYQSIALAAAQEIHAAIERLVRSYVNGDAFDDGKQEVIEYAQANPIEGHFGGLPYQRLSDDSAAKKALSGVVTLPLAPLTVLRGVGETPGSVRDVSHAVDRFTRAVEDFPASSRWELQLLAMNLEETPTVTKASANFKQVAESSTQLAESSTRLVQVIDEMPAQVREQAELLLDRVDASHPKLRETLSDAQKTVELVRTANQEISGTAAQLGDTMASVNQAADALKHTADAVTITIREIQKLVPTHQDDKTGHVIHRSSMERQDAGLNDALPASAVMSAAKGEALGGDAIGRRDADSIGSVDGGAPLQGTDTRFSFQALTSSADAVGQTTSKLQELLTDLRSFVDGQSISRESTALSAAFEDVVDHVVVRLGQLLVLLFVLMFCYAFIRTRWLHVRQRPTVV